MTDRPEKRNRYHQERYGDRSVAGLNKSARLRAELFAGWVGTGKRLLEIGCGAGALLELYAAGNRVTVLDVDDPTHMQFYSPASLRALLARAVTVEEIAPVRGKFSRRFPSLFAHNLAFRCRRADQT